MPPSSELQGLVFDRLMATGASDHIWSNYVLAALLGDADLRAALGGVAPNKPQPTTKPADVVHGAQGTAPVEPPGVYVASITVSGFRGIGPTATLSFKPGPGLTIVTGRNGSGKSSFAEGLELLLTGRTYRWEGRPKEWRDGWRNLHQPSSVSLSANLVVEGQGPLTVTREWTGSELDEAETLALRKGKSPAPLSSIGWDEHFKSYRPFLSYNELGSLLDEGPSVLYDELSRVLGLDELVEIQKRLANARKTCDQLARDGKDGASRLKALAEQAAEKVGERAQAVLACLEVRGKDPGVVRGRDPGGLKTWDLLKLEALALFEQATGETSPVATLRQLAAVRGPNPDEVADMVGRLRRAEQAWTAVVGTDAERARERADLLGAAVAFHQKHHAADCPVCGTPATLDATWLAKAQQEVDALNQQALAYLAAANERQARVREAQRFLTPSPEVLSRSINLGVAALPDLRRLWIDWSTGRDVTQAGELAAFMESRILELSESIAQVVAQADAEAQRLEDAWRPLAAAIMEWLPIAKKAQRAQQQFADLKKAEDWCKTTSGEVRDARFQPIANQAMAIWKTLRLRSNVDLGRVALTGAATTRKVTLAVTVDDTPAEALGVMSQGELNALALSLFLPRATLPESKFRFIAIDDPVQSMDPTRVEGLARVLQETAKRRQVIVFTHDDRLSEAVRRLQIPATILSVTRRNKSQVDVRQAGDPVLSYIEDARAVALTKELPADVAARVVPGFCRSAVEAACMEVIRRRRLGRGEPHDEVEQLLAQNTKTHPLMALALFDDAEKGGEVLTRLKNKFSVEAVDTFQACKAGAHEKYTGDVVSLVKASERLAQQVRALA